MSDKHVNILIVIADAAERTALRHYLSSPSRGVRFSFTDEDTGAGAIRLLRAQPFDCVFLDYALPDIDGITVLRAVRTPVTARTPSPVVILAGPGSETVMLDALSAGAQDYLLKETMSHATACLAMAKASVLFDAQQARDEAESQLIYARRMEAVGQITSGIAHDFNNILSVIAGSVHLLSREAADANWATAPRERLAAIEESVRKGTALVRRLSVFTNETPVVREVLDVNARVRDTGALLSRTLEESIEIRLSLDKFVWAVEADSTALENALVNLAVNARDAMPRGGTLTLETSNSALSGAAEGEYVMIAVSDTGTGMTPEVKERIFDPYFTTKPAGQGAGLGLAAVYAFVRQSKGHIRVHSTPECGSTFRLYLPRARTAA